MNVLKASTTSAVLFAACAALVALPVLAEQQDVLARVKVDRVNLRARADTTAEVVGQVAVDERLQVNSVSQEWVQVVAPDALDLWVHRDFVKDGVSTVNRLNVRAGAGINYTVVGALGRDDHVTVRGQFGEWLKIAPSNCYVWVSRDLVDLLYPAQLAEAPRVPVEVAAPASSGPTPAGEPPAGIVAEEPSRAPGTPAPALSAPPPDLRLVPLEGQGRLVQREGELKPAPFAIGRPSKFRLVRRDGPQYVTLCYVRGNSAQLHALLDQRLVVRGREYWVQGVRQPVVVLERIERRSP